ncbi:MAG: hypothetical protein SGPRY_012081 [Prymnesium sp.]
MPVYTECSAIGQPALPVSGTPFDIFLQEKLAKEGKLQADPAQCSQVSQAFAKAMAEDIMSPPTAALDRCPPPSEDTQPTSTASSLKRPRADAEGRACRAVLFDLDDTLVMTSAIDRAAIHNAALRTVGQREGELEGGMGLRCLVPLGVSSMRGPECSSEPPLPLSLSRSPTAFRHPTFRPTRVRT